MDSQEETTANIALTQNLPDTLSITSAKQKSKKSRTIIASGHLRPVHDPEVVVKVQILKRKANKKYAHYAWATVKTVSRGLRLDWSIKKSVKKGTYKIKVSIPTHQQWGGSLHRKVSKTSKAFVIK